MTTTESFEAPNLPIRQDYVQTAADLARYLLAGAATCYVLIYIALAGIRLFYPYELEWIEGACVDQVRWILAGKPLYVAPSVEFTSFCYAPLYFYIAAALAKVTGVGFLPLRLVSLIASLGCLLLLVQFVRRSTGSALWGLIAAGLFAATYRLSGAWLDIARVDSLFLLFVLAGIYCLRFGEGFWPLLLAGLFMSLAFVTKQTAMVICLPLIGYAFLAKPRLSAIAFAGSFLLLAVVSTAVLNLLTHGWYVYYAFYLPACHDTLAGASSAFWKTDIAAPLAIALAFSVVCILAQLSSDLRKQFGFFVALLIGMVGCSWLGRVHGAGYDNVLIPAYAFLAVCFAIGCHILQSYWQGRTPGTAALDKGLLLSLYCIGLIQFALLGYSPNAQIPAQPDIQAGDTLVEEMKALNGDVWIPYHGYLTVLAGHHSFAHAMAINDVLRGPEGPARTALLADIERAIRDRQFSAIVLDDEWHFKKPQWQPIMRQLAQQYNPPARIFANTNAFLPVTGWPTRPTQVCTLRQGPQTQPAATQPR